MTAADFEYDGLLLSDLGFMICQFDEATGFSSSSAGSTLDVTTVIQNSGRKHIMVGSTYKDANEPEFSICKKDGSIITTDEYGLIMHWLNRAAFYKLTILTADWQQISFMCTFNIEKVEHRGRIVGFNLMAITNSTFGWGDQLDYEFSIPAADGSYDILDESEEIGCLYLDSLEVTCSGAGDLCIINSIEPDRKTIVKDCAAGEIIKFDGKTLVVTSSVDPKIYDRFNFNYVRIANTLIDSINTLSFSIPCTVKLSYTPARKVVF